MSDRPLLVVIGPTAVGKTALSVRLAQDVGGEIVSADSRQIYRGLDIGADKASAAQQALAPHHLLDVVDPDQVLTLAEFQERAYATIAAIHRRNRLPLLVGGTGQWVWAVVEGWGIPRVPPDPALRAKLAARAEAVGAEALHAQLEDVDPLAAQKLDPRNVRRVIRALEVYQKTGVPISQHQQKNPPPYHTLLIGLTMPREILYNRIDRRVEKMMDSGLVAEVEGLAAAGYDWRLPALSGLGYRQIGQYLQGQFSLAEAVALIKKETRRFMRQQYNWFRLADPRIDWFDLAGQPEETYAQIKHLVTRFQGAK
ncbi:MAG: tRNA (adenosine(37)-N6)-dimethylallyltransferase MiaA [Anaerolineae bacterium]|nr:tRNA (adenosine(37)-N6)-dimethylallyltransferase MiaA [Anaerolineae bacterium]